MDDSAPTDNGWTTVGRSKASRKSYVEVPRANGPDRNITLVRLRQEFDKKSAFWKKSAGRKTLLRMLRNNAPDNGWNFTKAVCLATGSFSTGNSELNSRSMLQLACFVDLTSEMSSHSNEPLEKYAQEPNYTPLDSAFLSTFNISVLPLDPIKDTGLGPATHHFSPSTLLCSFFLNLKPISARQFFAAQHGLYIGTPFDQAFLNAEGDLREAKEKFEREYVMRKIPCFEEDPGVFEGLGVWWPEPGVEEDEEEEAQKHG